MRVDSNGIHVEKGDVNPYFPLRTPREIGRYHISSKHMPCIFHLGGSKTTPTSETSNYDVCIEV